MSLINQALRKAQRDRTPSTLHSAGAQPAAYAPGAAEPSNKRGLLIGLTLGVAVLVGLVAGLSIAVFKQTPAAAPPPSTRPESPQSSAGTAALPEATQAAAQSEPTAATQPIQPLTAASTMTAATIPTNEPDSADVLQQLQRARAAAQAKAAAEAEAAQKADAMQAAETKITIPANQDIVNWLSQAKITGVRLSDSGNKVILNNKPYATGETVHFALGLKVLIIQQARVFFIDANGKKYMKRL